LGPCSQTERSDLRPQTSGFGRSHRTGTVKLFAGRVIIGRWELGWARLSSRGGVQKSNGDVVPGGVLFGQRRSVGPSIQAVLRRTEMLVDQVVG
jgi:hypothetical protein